MGLLKGRYINIRNDERILCMYVCISSDPPNMHVYRLIERDRKTDIQTHRQTDSEREKFTEDNH